MEKTYDNELEGQHAFYQTYLPRVDSSITQDEIQSNYTDGVVNGNILEFKLNINDLNSVLFQTIKYLSSMRVKGKSIPRNILLVSLNDEKVYLYYSEKYLQQIETIYIGGASKDNHGFVCGNAEQVYDLTQDIAQENIITLLRSCNYTRINIDENCIVGWGQRYYRENPMANKSDFIGDETGKIRIIGEIRQPEKFKEYILPYKGKSNERFRYLMDKLNDDIQKKNLGAFYTNRVYADKSLELLRKAISRVPKGNDYIILDRCAGTGNLELGMTTEELSHTIVSTLEYYEYKVLSESLGDKVRHIIPPTEKEDTFNMGLVRGADALSKEYVDNQIIKQYIDNPSCTIILFENPPYAETTSLEHQRRKISKKSSSWKDSFIVQEMKKEIKGAATNDLGNAFIWSAFKYYLRQPTDSYVVYSPVKYWKAQHIINRKFLGGFAFNRKHFHTNIDACVMCAYWGQEESNISEFNLIGYDINKNNELVALDKPLPIRKINSLFSQKYYDRTTMPDCTEDGILIGLNGLEADSSVKRRITPIYSPEMMGYLVADSAGFDNPDAKSSLLVAGRYNGNGFFLHKSNYLEKLPMFAASRYITYNRAWTERARIMKSADGYKRYFADLKSGKLNQFMLQCLLFTCLEAQNHMQEFTGSDGRYYGNNLTLDTSNGSTLAAEALSGFIPNETEKELLAQWNKVLEAAKKTTEYIPTINYGLYQIKCDLNTSHYDEETGTTIFHYPDLNGHIKSLAELVKRYYNTTIVPMLFQYEFLK